MTVADIRAWRRRLVGNPLAAALVLSLVIHLALFGTWRLGQKLGWWKHQSTWLAKLTEKLTSSKPRRFDLQPSSKPPQNQRQEIPLTFLEVDPTTAVEKAPENAKFYSTKNTVAANPDPDTKPTPKIDGQQDQVVRLMDNEKPKPFPLQPAPPKPPEEQAPPKPKGGEAGEKPGDLALNKPRDPKPPSEGITDATKGQALTVPPEKIRTLAAARQKAMLSGEKVRQAGGSPNRGRVGFDAKATAFGEYDSIFIAAVQTRWNYLIENNLVTPRSGRVVCDFKLTYDGRIIDMKVENNDVGEILGMFCRNAIEDNQRYPKWPEDMRRTIGSNTREIRFTFIYY